MIEWTPAEDSDALSYLAVSGITFSLRTATDGRLELSLIGHGRRAPRWRRETREEIDAVVADHEERFREIPDGAIPEYWPYFKVDGPETVPVDPQPPAPPALTPCHACGSDATAVYVAPIAYTCDWWFDGPKGYWLCPRCDLARVER
jgi:hypothetical protein